MILMRYYCKIILFFLNFGINVNFAQIFFLFFSIDLIGMF